MVEEVLVKYIYKNSILCGAQYHISKQNVISDYLYSKEVYFYNLCLSNLRGA
jgi:hypothetical protein